MSDMPAQPDAAGARDTGAEVDLGADAGPGASADPSADADPGAADPGADAGPGAAADPGAPAGLGALAALGEPARRALYAYIAAQGRPISRDEAAGATGMRRATAAFHLERLVEDGLLEAGFARLSGRTGPGAGRT